jgi:hypothetical protein
MRYNLIVLMLKILHDYTIKTICFSSSQSSLQSQLFTLDNKLTSALGVIHVHFMFAPVRLKIRL